MMLPRTVTRQRGFTLIELMIVVVIIGILAAMAVPRFMRAATKSKQSEAKQILKQIYTMQHQYRVDHATYWGAGISASATAPNTFGTIAVEIMPSALYTYTITTADMTNLLITATSGILDADAVIDTWTCNQDGLIICTSNDSEF